MTPVCDNLSGSIGPVGMCGGSPLVVLVGLVATLLVGLSTVLARVSLAGASNGSSRTLN